MNIQDIEKLVEHIEEKADSIFGIDLKRLNVIYTKKGTVAGTCRYDTHYNFNLQVARDNDHFEDTVWHELAHQISYQVYGRKGCGHSVYWKRVMAKLGRDPRRCHNYQNIKPGRVTKQYSYKCGCGRTLILSSVRYNKVMRGKASYTHGCGRKIDMNKAIKVRG